MSRREEIAMSPAEVDDYLASELTVILISNGPHGFPHPMPMHFCVESGPLLAMTTYRKSQKVVNLRRDPRAALLVESGADYAELRSVLIYARAEVIDHHDATLACMLACRRHSNAVRGRASSATEDAQFEHSAAQRARKRLVLKFQPESCISWDHGKLGGQY